MKRCVLFLLTSTLLTVTNRLLAQGSLTPSGPPGPTMITLSQIEPRIPISSGAYTISNSGSYYLTTNIAMTSGTAITITANNVTLDLHGFTISSTAAGGSGDGILLSSVQRIHILNGYITGGITNYQGTYSGNGFASGIYYSAGQAPHNVLVSGVTVSGCLDEGIYLLSGNATVIESCTVNTVGYVGLAADSVINSSAINCGSYGVLATTAQNSYGESIATVDGLSADDAENCYGYCTGSGAGLNANVAHNCTGISSSGDGLDANNAENCSGTSEGGGDGLYADNTAANCTGQSASGIGLNVGNSAANCSGQSASGIGLNAGYSAANCYGLSTSDTGLYTFFVAQGCCGQTTSGAWALDAGTAENCIGYCTGGDGGGIIASCAHNCYGYSYAGSGLEATLALNCVGDTQGLVGLTATTANNCFGYSSSIGVSADIAVACGGTGQTHVSADNYYDMPTP